MTQLEQQLAINPYKNRVVKAKSEREDRQISFYGFPNFEQAERIQHKWQKKVIHQTHKNDFV